MDLEILDHDLNCHQNLGAIVPHPNPPKISSESFHNFLCNLADRQTDKPTDNEKELKHNRLPLAKIHTYTNNLLQKLICLTTVYIKSTS